MNRFIDSKIIEIRILDKNLTDNVDDLSGNNNYIHKININENNIYIFRRINVLTYGIKINIKNI
jgi:hypothetical protein